MMLCPRCGERFVEDASYCPHDGSRLEPEVRATFEGTVIDGRYLLQQRIGAGGLGEVYRAQHVRMERTYAVKLIQPSAAGQPELIERFDREAKALSRLHHPCCVEVTDYGVSQQGHGPYIVMELVQGEPLSHHTTGDGLPLGVALDLIVMALDGLHHAHEQGIIHRDLKPDNIMLVQRPLEPDRLLPKLLDFGLAKVRLSRAGGGADLTQMGIIFGTPFYMAPERVDDPAIDDIRSDIYSMGVVLYELCCGERPFFASDLMQLLRAHQSQAPRPPRLLRPELPEALEQIILRALAKRPDERFGSAAELAAALQALLPLPEPLASALPPKKQARPTRAATQVERPRPAPAPGAPLASAPTVASAAGAAVAPVPPPAAAPAPSTAPLAPPRRRGVLLALVASAVLLAAAVVATVVHLTRPPAAVTGQRKSAAAVSKISPGATRPSARRSPSRSTAPAPSWQGEEAEALPEELRATRRLWDAPRQRKRAAKQFMAYLSRHKTARAYLYVGRLYLYAFWAQDGLELVRKGVARLEQPKLDTSTLVALTFAYRGRTRSRARTMLHRHAGERTRVVLLASAAAMRDRPTKRRLLADAARLPGAPTGLARKLKTLATARKCGARHRALSEVMREPDAEVRIMLTLARTDPCLGRRVRATLARWKRGAD